MRVKVAWLVIGLAGSSGCSGKAISQGNPFVAGGGGTAGATTAGGGGVASIAGGGVASIENGGGLASIAGSEAGGMAGVIGGGAVGGQAVGGWPAASVLEGNDITAVVKSDGCARAFLGQTGAVVTIQTAGTKDPDCADHLNGEPKCGAWSTPRDYYLYLPANYDQDKVYPLIFQGPGCGGKGRDVLPLNNNADNSVIRIGLSPGPNSLGHGTNENQGCFDNREGDDSIDWVFYENVYDKLNAELCFDRNRVFVSGDSAGAWFSNELACKYAGDARRPVRGVMASSGGLPTDPRFVPTCTNAALAGMWVHEVMNTENFFADAKVAITRAMLRDGCTIGDSYDNATFEDFPIGGGVPDDTCKHILGCDPRYPLVVCALPGQGRGGDDRVVNPGFAAFAKSFEYPPLLTP